MIIEKKSQQRITIDIDGADGNAFALMGYAKTYARQLDIDHKGILNEMMSGDYNNLLCVFDKYFGEFVTIETSNDEILDAISNNKQS